MIEILQFEFMRNALMAGFLASIACGVVGCYVVVKRIVFISGGISHSAYGGIGLGYFLGFDPLFGATIFSLLSALGIGVVSRFSKERIDTLIGVIWALGMAIGIILVNLTPGYAPDLMSYLFGSILTVPLSDIILLAVLDGFIVALVLIHYNEFLAFTFDEEYAEVIGLPVMWLYLLLLSLIALTVVILIKIVGIILVIALLSIPAAISGRFTYNLKHMMIASTVLGMVFSTSGLFLAYYLGAWFNVNMPSGGTIIIVACIGYFISMFIPFQRQREKAKMSA